MRTTAGLNHKRALLVASDQTLRLHFYFIFKIILNGCPKNPPTQFRNLLSRQTVKRICGIFIDMNVSDFISFVPFPMWPSLNTNESFLRNSFHSHIVKSWHLEAKRFPEALGHLIFDAWGLTASPFVTPLLHHLLWCGLLWCFLRKGVPHTHTLIVTIIYY